MCPVEMNTVIRRLCEPVLQLQSLVQATSCLRNTHNFAEGHELQISQADTRRNKNPGVEIDLGVGPGMGGKATSGSAGRMEVFHTDDNFELY